MKHVSKIDDDPTSDLWYEWLTKASSVSFNRATVVSNNVDMIMHFNRALGVKVAECIMRYEPEEFINACFFIDHRPESLTSIRIPKQLIPLALITHPKIGRGEIALMFCCTSAMCKFGDRIDITIHSEGWHVKEISKPSECVVMMGTAKGRSFVTSDTAQKLAQIDRTFLESTTDALITQYASEITKKFGSIDDFENEFKNEAIKREFNDVAGICVFRSSNMTFEFHRKHDIVKVRSSMSRYQMRIKKIRHPDTTIDGYMKELNKLFVTNTNEVRCVYVLSGSANEIASDGMLKIVEVVDDGFESDAIPVNGVIETTYATRRIPISQWNESLRLGKNIVLPEHWNWNKRRSVA